MFQKFQKKPTKLFFVFVFHPVATKKSECILSKGKITKIYERVNE